jgi:hypothetical protein
VDWTSLVIGVFGIVYFGRSLPPRGAERQAVRNRGTMGSTNPRTIRVLALLFVVVGVYLVVRSLPAL